MQSPVLVSYPHHIQSPKVHLSPLTSAVPITLTEVNGYAHPQAHTLTTTVVQNLSHPTMFIQPVGHVAPAVQLSTPPPQTVFPPEDITKTHTTASYSKELTPELVNNDKGHWVFSLNVPIPEKMVYPTLTSLKYTVKYGTGNGHGTSTIQTSILLTKVPKVNSQSTDDDSNTDDDDDDDDSPPEPTPDGIITDSPHECNYRTGVGFPPQTLGGVPTVCLSSVPAVKENGYSSQWEYYIDKQQILPHVRIIGDSRLHLQLDVAETASTFMLRSLTVNVSATWVEDTQGKAMHDKIKAAERRTEIAEQKKARAEQGRLQAERKSAEARRAKDIAEKETDARAKKEREARMER